MTYFECGDINGFIGNLKDLDVKATQVSKGNFFCKRHRLSLPFLEIHYWQVKTSILYHGRLAHDSFLVSFPVNREFQKIDGKFFGKNSILALLPDENLIVLHPEEVVSLDFVINPLLFIHYFKWDNIDTLYNLIGSLRKTVELTTEKKLQSKKLIDITLNLIHNTDQLSYQSILDMRDLILINLFKFLDHSIEEVKISSSNHRIKIVNRALDSIHNNPHTNLTTLDLASKCFCSLRTLEYAFKTILDITPKEYLIKRRLNLIRQEIQTYRKKPINRIAMDYGVVNAGRFSRDYFQFFGEYPSETRGGCVQSSLSFR